MIRDEDVAAFGAALNDLQRPLLAYCRTGTRSATLWSFHESKSRPMAEILARYVSGSSSTGIAPDFNNTLDIEATLTDAKPRRFGFGAELSSLEGLAVTGFWLHRNLLGGAERLLSMAAGNPAAMAVQIPATLE